MDEEAKQRRAAMMTRLMPRIRRLGRAIMFARREGREVYTRHKRLVIITDNRNAKMNKIREARGMS